MIVKYVLVLSALTLLTNANDTFDEELVLSPLANGHVYAFFNFVTKWQTTREDALHTNLFPRALVEIIHQYSIAELSISLTSGQWRHEFWGYPVFDAPPGAEVYARFHNTTEPLDRKWKLLTEALSGLLCASLNFIDSSNTVTPTFTFSNGKRDDTANLRYSTLPREIVCTENLTPWKKLLPCDSKKGLSSLLNPEAIHNTRYHSLQLHVKRSRNETLELRQSVALVYDTSLVNPSGHDWSFRTLFNVGLFSSCPLARSSTIYVDLFHNTSNTFDLKPAASRRVRANRGGFTREYAVYNLKERVPLNLAYVSIGARKITLNVPPPLFVNRYLTGYGQERGGIAMKLVNKHWDALDVTILENLPWFISVYLHTLKIKSRQSGSETVTILTPLFIKYIPGCLREKPYSLELGLKLPAKSTTTISIDFDYAFLKWQEYPPDANHGFYIGSAIISCPLPLARNYTTIPDWQMQFGESLNQTRSSYTVRIYTETLLVTLPTPDFSMPYNVICLACTIIALAFGPIHNITTKDLTLHEDGKTGAVGFFARVKARLFKRAGNEVENVTVPDRE